MSAQFFNGPAGTPTARVYRAGENVDSEVMPTPTFVHATDHLTDVQIFRAAMSPQPLVPPHAAPDAEAHEPWTPLGLFGVEQ
jgi:hypothetical protein